MQDMTRWDPVNSSLLLRWQDSDKINQEENYEAISEKKKGRGGEKI